MKKWMIVALQLAITSAHPPLSPAEAVRVLTGQPPTAEHRLYLTGLTGVKPRPAAPTIRISNGGDPRNGPYGSLGTYPVQAPLTCCSTYRTNLRSGQQWLDGERVR